MNHIKLQLTNACRYLYKVYIVIFVLYNVSNSIKSLIIKTRQMTHQGYKHKTTQMTHQGYKHKTTHMTHQGYKHKTTKQDKLMSNT
jgi:hypothetical protein